MLGLGRFLFEVFFFFFFLFPLTCTSLTLFVLFFTFSFSSSFFGGSGCVFRRFFRYLFVCLFNITKTSKVPRLKADPALFRILRIFLLNLFRFFIFKLQKRRRHQYSALLRFPWWRRTNGMLSNLDFSLCARERGQKKKEPKLSTAVGECYKSHWPDAAAERVLPNQVAIYAVPTDCRLVLRWEPAGFLS